MRVAIVFPPVFNAAQPYGSIHILATAIKEVASEVVAWDWNIDFLENVFAETNASREVLAVFRDQRFYNPMLYQHAMLGFKQHLRTWTMQYDAVASFWGFESNKYSSTSSQQLILASNDNKANPFIDLFEHIYVQKLETFKPDLVGFSVADKSQLIATFTLSRLIKEFCQDIFICIGGPLIALLQEPFSKIMRANSFPYIDAFVIGEGQKPLTELCHRLITKSYWQDIPNIISKRGKSQFLTNDINSLISPDPHFLTNQLYVAPEIVYPVLVKRGCSHNACHFCNIPYFSHKMGGPAKSRSYEIICDSVQSLNSIKNISYFFLVGEELTAYEAMSVANEFTERNLSVRWYYWSRFDSSYSRKILKKLFLAGCRKICFGFETASARLLKNMNKQNDINDVKRILHICGEVGIAPHIYVMVGLPTETEADIQCSIDFLLKQVNVSNLPGLTITISPFELCRHTMIERHPQRFGIAKILRDPMDDLALTYEYIRSDKVTNSNISERAKLVKESLNGALEKQPFIGKMNAHHLLYLSYLESFNG